MEFSKNKLSKRIDWVTVALTLGLAVFGVICIASATSVGFEEGQSLMAYIGSLFSGNALRQLIFLIISIGLAVGAMFLDYNNIRDFVNYIFWGAVGILAIVLIFGSRQRGMTGWFYLPGLNVGIQPGEFCKVAAIIVFAKEFAHRTEGRTIGITRFRELWPVLWKCGLLAGLVVLQPDFGTAMIYIAIAMALLFMAKTSFKVLGPLMGGGLACLPLLWLLLTPDQKNRVYVFLDPTLDPEGAGYNVLRAKAVSSSGGMWGKGLFSTDLLTQRTNYLPEEHTDFIFSSTCEAIGFFGAFLLVAFYVLLIVRLFRLSMRAKDDFGAYLILGVAFMLLFHFIENVGMNIGIMPVTGIPLPLISYGGSNLMTTMVAIGLALNVDMRRGRNNKLNLEL